jgi:hypothetical protein
MPARECPPPSILTSMSQSHQRPTTPACPECESSRAEVHMAVDSDSPVPKPSRGEPRDAADLERGELEQEQTDSQMTDAPRDVGIPMRGSTVNIRASVKGNVCVIRGRFR